MLYSAFTERPKHLDPAQSYTTSESPFLAQIYEPPVQYHYLKRPYVLEPLTATLLPEIQYYNQAGEKLPETASVNEIAYTDYIIHLKPGILYQPHPAFVQAPNGEYRYHHLSPTEIKKYTVLSDFRETATRELTAEDYVYEIKRLALPSVSSPIFGMMSRYIEGLQELHETLVQTKKQKNHTTENSALELDLRAFTLSGAEVLDKYTYRIRIKGKYPQFRFWLAMHFFAPVPWEVAQFYAQPGLAKRNITLDWYPVGTGPFMLAENNPERRMVLIKNPNYRGGIYPTEGEAADDQKGLLADAGKPIPFIDKIIFTLEKENIPYWDKFLQGYYDVSGISSDNFTSTIQFTPQGGLDVTEEYKRKGIRLQTSVTPDVFYWGFNMLDETVGGNSERARKLRTAINLAFDVEEYISIFLNDRGEVAYGPIPKDIFGYETQKPTERSLTRAKALLKEAGYGEGLTLYFDALLSGGPDEIALQAWLKKQFAKLNIQLIIRGSDYNRFQDKVRNGTTQLFFFGWNADYPDPENFLFLFYGPNSTAKYGGENSTNYSNPEFDKLYDTMRALPDGGERLQLIAQMVAILQQDAPWVWGFYPKSYALYHEWMRISKPSGIINNGLKYARVDANLRAKDQLLWNKPKVWPLWIFLILMILGILPAVYWTWRREHTPIKRI